MTTTKQIIDFLQFKVVNYSEFDITLAKAPDDLASNSVTLLTRPEEFTQLFANSPKNVLAIIPDKLKDEALKFNQTFILSPDPRLSFVKVLNFFFDKPFIPKIDESAIIQTTKKIHNNINIGANVVIKGEIEIGENTEIGDNVVIVGNVIIGRNVRVKSGTIIGQKGFNFVYDENKIPIEFPHSGRVIIGNNVELGALNTVVRGTLGDTVISDYVKTDDHVHIAHNVKIGSGTLITACAEISGSVTIGSHCWLGPNCSIIDHIQIGDNVLIGLGAVVTKPVSPNVIIVGNPAKVIKIRKEGK